MQTEQPSTSRAQARAQLERDIIRVGRAHLAEHGAAALSLRAVARDLGMVSSAVYRYVRSRDELLTLLVVDAYDESADRVADALDGADATSGVHDRLRVAAHALRQWAVGEPSRFALIYGSPVPGYSAPAEQTTGPGTRFVALLMAELAAWSGTARAGTARVTVPQQLSREFDAVRAEFDLAIDDYTILVGTCLWSAILGSISLEVFGQYGTDTFSQPEVLFDLQLAMTLERLLP